MGKFKNAIAKFFTGAAFGGDSFLWNPIGGFLGRNKKTLLREYRNLVYSCVSTIAEDVGQYEPLFYAGAIEEERQINNHPFHMLLQSPNEYMTQYELFEATQSYIELTGDAFWYLELGMNSRLPSAIHIVEPHRVDIKVHQTTGDITHYEILDYSGVPVRCEVDEIIHFKMFNPLNPYRGLGTVEAGLLYIDTEYKSSDFQHSFMENHGMPSANVDIQGNVSKEAFEGVKKNYKQQFAGAGNAGKILFTRNAGIVVNTLSSSLADLDMSALKKLSQDEVRAMFRMPKAMLGASDESGLGRANVEAIEYSYAKRTIDPKLVRIDDTIRLYVRKAYNQPDLYVSHVSQVPADKEALRAQAKELTYSVLTQNESRALFGEPPLEGGDSLYVPFNMTAIGSPVESVVPANLAATYGTMKLRSTRHILETPQPEIQKAGGQTRYLEQLDRIEQQSETEVEFTLARILADQERHVLARLRERNKSIDEDDIEDIEPSTTEDVELISLAILPSLINAMEAGGNAALIYVGSPDAEFVIEQAVRDKVFNSTERLMQGFNKETALKIQKQLAAGLQEGETVEQLARRIESVYGEAKGYRSTAIARSESNRLVTQGTTDAYSQAGYSQVRWVTDSSPCPICQDLEGTIIDIGTSFVGVGDTIPTTDRANDYAPIEGGDAHTNCMCKLVPITDSDKAYKQIVKVEKHIHPDEDVVRELAEVKEYAQQLELIVGIDGTSEET